MGIRFLIILLLFGSHVAMAERYHHRHHSWRGPIILGPPIVRPPVVIEEVITPTPPPVVVKKAKKKKNNGCRPYVKCLDAAGSDHAKCKRDFPKCAAKFDK